MKDKLPYQLDRWSTADLLRARTALRKAAAEIRQACAPLPPEELLGMLRSLAKAFGAQPLDGQLLEHAETLQALPAVLAEKARRQVKETLRYPRIKGGDMPFASDILEAVAEERAEAQHWQTLVVHGVMAVEGQLAERAKKTPKPSNGAPTST